jgi:hypothetical protein
VEKSEPAASKKDAAPPFLVTRDAGRSTVAIRARNLGAGGSCSTTPSSTIAARPSSSR